MTFNPPIYGADVNGSLYDPVSRRLRWCCSSEYSSVLMGFLFAVCVSVDWLIQKGWWQHYHCAAYNGFKSHLLILYYLLHSRRKSKSGTFVIWTPFWILWNVKAASLLRVLIHPTCILACGRPPLHGTLRTWTSTVLTTCTLENPNHGKVHSLIYFLDQVQT